MKPILAAFVILFFVRASAQPGNDKLTTCDDDWKPTKSKKATYLLCERKTNDTCFQVLHYNNFGPRIKIESYKDENKTIRHGRYADYFPDGTLDSAGDYTDGKQDGRWIYLSRVGKSYHIKFWNKGILLSDSAYNFNDSLKNKDLRPGEVESEFPGGIPEWQRFLNKNLRYPARAIDHTVMGTVRVEFIVDKDGYVLEPDVIKSVEYSLDEESLRIIVKSDQWTPASKDGVPKRSYKIQPIVYKLVK
jgi:protein TonB